MADSSVPGVNVPGALVLGELSASVSLGAAGGVFVDNSTAPPTVSIGGVPVGQRPAACFYRPSELPLPDPIFSGAAVPFPLAGPTNSNIFSQPSPTVVAIAAPGLYRVTWQLAPASSYGSLQLVLTDGGAPAVVACSGLISLNSASCLTQTALLATTTPGATLSLVLGGSVDSSVLVFPTSPALLASNTLTLVGAPLGPGLCGVGAVRGGGCAGWGLCGVGAVRGGGCAPLRPPGLGRVSGGVDVLGGLVLGDRSGGCAVGAGGGLLVSNASPPFAAVDGQPVFGGRAAGAACFYARTSAPLDVQPGQALAFPLAGPASSTAIASEEAGTVFRLAAPGLYEVTYVLPFVVGNCRFQIVLTDGGAPIFPPWGATSCYATSGAAPSPAASTLLLTATVGASFSVVVLGGSATALPGALGAVPAPAIVVSYLGGAQAPAAGARAPAFAGPGVNVPGVLALGNRSASVVVGAPGGLLVDNSVEPPAISVNGFPLSGGLGSGAASFYSPIVEPVVVGVGEPYAFVQAGPANTPEITCEGGGTVFRLARPGLYEVIYTIPVETGTAFAQFLLTDGGAPSIPPWASSYGSGYNYPFGVALLRTTTPGATFSLVNSAAETTLILVDGVGGPAVLSLVVSAVG